MIKRTFPLFLLEQRMAELDLRGTALWADSSNSKNSSFFVFFWNSPPPTGRGVTDCIVFAPLHTPAIVESTQRATD